MKGDLVLSHAMFDRARDAAKLRAHPMSGWLNPVHDPLPEIRSAKRLVWCGIGGSLLPTRAIVAAFANADERERFVALGSSEPNGYELAPDDQLVFASKSGKTLELWTWISRLSANPLFSRLERTPIVVTQDDDNPLARWARARGYPIVPIPVAVGGRFSAFTGIGTLPLAWLGRDVSAYLDGGTAVASSLESGSHPMLSNVDELGAAWLREATNGVTEWVFIPYLQRLAMVSDFWVQLVAESLGKEGPDGRRHGFTPLRGVGPDDQHAQLQRWMAGPRNVGVLVLSSGMRTKEVLAPPAECPFVGLERLDGTEIVAAQALGTIDALRGASVPTLHFRVDEVTERSLGELIMGLHIVVGLTGMAMGIDPFDQPAVEDGKKRTLKRLGLL